MNDKALTMAKDSLVVGITSVETGMIFLECLAWQLRSHLDTWEEVELSDIQSIFEMLKGTTNGMKHGMEVVNRMANLLIKESVPQ